MVSLLRNNFLHFLDSPFVFLYFLFFVLFYFFFVFLFFFMTGKFNNLETSPVNSDDAALNLPTSASPHMQMRQRPAGSA